MVVECGVNEIGDEACVGSGGFDVTECDFPCLVIGVDIIIVSIPERNRQRFPDALEDGYGDILCGGGQINVFLNERKWGFRNRYLCILIEGIHLRDAFCASEFGRAILSSLL